MCHLSLGLIYVTLHHGLKVHPLYIVQGKTTNRMYNSIASLRILKILKQYPSPNYFLVYIKRYHSYIPPLVKKRGIKFDPRNGTIWRTFPVGDTFYLAG